MLAANATELDAALLQMAVTLGMAMYAAFLHARYRKPYFLWFAVAMLIYVLRLGAILSFLLTDNWIWLYWHQVTTGWTALALLWAALVFSRQLSFKPAYLAALLVPLVWSYITIYQLDSFMLAAGSTVVLLSLVTGWTGWIFLRHWRKVGSSGAAFLAFALLLWAVHHLDYPFLRARGAWSPWGYYLDIVFILATAAGMTILVMDDLRQGLGALAALSWGERRALPDEDDLAALLRRSMALPATRGAALFLLRGESPELVRGAGACVAWANGAAPSTEARRAGTLVSRAIAAGRPSVEHEWSATGAGGEAFAFAAVLPIVRDRTVSAALLIVGDARDPFAALDESFLVALGHQIGGALEGAELTRRLKARTADLTRLSARMIEQHEAERRRISLELHDETAQVFSAVKLQLGVLRERADPATADQLTRALELVDTGMQSIRDVTETLRPTLLDDLGLLAAMRSLASDYPRRCGIAVVLEAPDELPVLPPEAELALFRSMQEALSNVARHAGAERVSVCLTSTGSALELDIQDDGRGLAAGADLARLEREGHMGLAGMRERIASLGGTVVIEGGGPGGVRVRVRIPL